MEIPQTTTTRELDQKMERLQRILFVYGLDGVLLRMTSNFAWATCGADAHINTADSTGIASLLITHSNRYVITNNIEAARLMEEERLAGEGWEFSVAPWFDRVDPVSGMTRGMKLGADVDYPGAVNLSSELAALRVQLTPEEGDRFRALGKLCAQGMREAIDTAAPGMNEFELAGALAQAVEKRGVQTVVNLVAADQRIFKYRHPLPTANTLQKYAMLVLCGRKGGLICSLTRLVHFGTLPDEIRRKAEAVARIDAAMIAATRPGRSLGDVFGVAQTAYAEAGYPDEWQLHHQGGSAGYAPREVTAAPESPDPILSGQVFAWNPSITGAKSEDTILVGDQANEIITETAGWPVFEFRVGEDIVRRPAVLEK